MQVKTESWKPWNETKILFINGSAIETQRWENSSTVHGFRLGGDYRRESTMKGKIKEEKVE